MTEDFSRRPIASRNTKWAAYVTRQLVARQVAPNHISIASVVAAVGAGRHSRFRAVSQGRSGSGFCWSSARP
ncbi:hypothetical protein [Paracoccus sp. (in: a-proteobacteria)]|uniref:hypothetical protein n=1 Tax=Paracoccus sp. TaxID=267 RepID=UPI0035B2C56A